MKLVKPTNRERIEHILDSVKLIQSFIQGCSLVEFEQDKRSYFACLYQFAVIGEAIAKIDDLLLKKYDYPWYKVKAFRNFIMHEYHAIDARVVWDTIILILPGFKENMEKILEDEF